MPSNPVIALDMGCTKLAGALLPLPQEMQTTLQGTQVGVAIDSDRACGISGVVWRGVPRVAAPGAMIHTPELTTT